ncbi:AMP-binding protein [Candidatus Mycolicibacterium alkanivorans]|uniref:AMP-binding protein n=1 Tax=Candidatus Mycolicibacterium alkanivorans TaxID=2954114 RepID=A0ABS9YSQ3_9MYCO|nr:AMP-binding protein [Candidatus Mycolicibacterium alkanivorans]MCI4674256.1 AMP-binding protein [Candidatus Mycolicibacterium alkanivorans]
MLNTKMTLPALLRHQATTQGDVLAFSFMDGAVIGTGHPESLTWNQLYRRVLTLAEELRHVATKGDRVAILAPQGLDYVVAFYASLQAGMIAVPLSVPMFGVHDQRVESALEDSAPSVLLTTSAAVADVNKYANPHGGRPAPTVIEVDVIDVDVTRALDETDDSRHGPAYLQYTSGSTRTPAGVIVSHQNVTSNIEQVVSDYFVEYGGTVPDEAAVVSWLPFFHDMGLIMGVCSPLVTGCDAVLTSPLAFLAKPASWMQLMAQNTMCFSGAPNFAFELAMRRTTDADLEGLDLSQVHAILSGAERVHYSTVKRFVDRFAKFGLTEKVIRPSYGLAEATLYVASPPVSETVGTARFDLQQLAAGVAQRCDAGRESGTQLVGYGPPQAYPVRIVDPETGIEVPEGAIGEIWTRGDNVALGYWRKSEQTARVFRARINNPSEGTPAGPWLRTGDLGAISDGEMFIMGRLKDLLIVDGRNHYPEDIEATIREVTGGRVAAIAVEDEASENLVAIVEVKPAPQLESVKHEVADAVWKSHNLRMGDLVLVPPGSIPITTSGKIRRSSCVEIYREGEFHRLDIAV